MKRIPTLAAVLAAASVLAGAANAADLPPRAAPPMKAPVYAAPPFSWTGFYLGGNFGYGWGEGSGTMTFGGATGPIRGSGDGVLGGVQAGYNWQMGAMVVGIETDFQGSSATGDFSGTLLPGPVAVVGRTETPWFGTIRGRLGYAADRWLFYVTGGGAYSHSTSSGTVGGAPFAASATGWSWTVGGGIENAITNAWSIKGEYLYIDTPDKTPIPAGAAVTGSAQSHIIRLGVNYHF